MKNPKVFLSLIFNILMLSLVGAAFAAPPISFGVSGPKTKVGNFGNGGDAFSSGHHSISIFGENIFTTWGRSGSNGHDVVVARNGANGADFFIGSDIVGSEPGAQSALAVDSDGYIHVAWHTGNQLKYARSNSPGGQTYTTPILLSGTEGAGWGPSITTYKDAGNNMNIYVAYTSDHISGSSNEIYIKTSSDGGSTWGNPIWVNDWTLAYWGVPLELDEYSNEWGDKFPSIAVDLNGDLHMTFSWAGAPMYTSSTNGGVDWDEPIIVIGSVGYGANSYPSIATVNGTDIYVSWETGGKIYCASSHDSGGPSSWGEPVPVDPGTGGYHYTSAAVNSNGDVYVAARIDQQIKLYKSKDGGGSWSTPYIAGDGTDPHLAIDNNGKAIVMWADTNNKTVFFTREQ
ncbi:MAG: sialidase family protein [Thermodesulfobacteriota bacterium]